MFFLTFISAIHQRFALNLCPVEPALSPNFGSPTAGPSITPQMPSFTNASGAIAGRECSTDTEFAMSDCRRLSLSVVSLCSAFISFASRKSSPRFAFFLPGLIVLASLLLPAGARAQVTYAGTQSTLTTISGATADMLSPIAVDGAGDVFYVVQDGNTFVNTLYEIPFGGSQTAKNTNFPFLPSAIAVNNAGTALYFIYYGTGSLCSGGSTSLPVVAVLNSPFTATPSNLPQTFTFSTYCVGYTDATGIAVNPNNGNLYVADFGGGAIYELNGPVTASSTPASFVFLYVQPWEIAVNGNGTIYFTYDSTTQALASVSASSFSSNIASGGVNASIIVNNIPDIQSGLAVGPSPTNTIYLGGTTVDEVSGSSLVAVNNEFGYGTTGLGVDSNGQLFIGGYDTNYDLNIIGTSPLPYVNFGSEAINSTTSAQSLNFSIDAGTTVGSIGILTTGIANLDFLDGGSTTCTATTYSSATNCVVSVKFKPLATGLRRGAVVFYSGANLTGTLQAIVQIYGTGTGPQAAFGPAGNINVGSGFTTPLGIAADAAGNVFVADNGAGKVDKVTPGGAQNTVTSSIANPYGVAVDGAGNLYVADSSTTVYMVTPGGTKSTVNSTFSSPYGIALDGQGDFYVSDHTAGKVYEVTPSGTKTTVYTGLSSPEGVAVDAAGNVYVANTGGGEVYMMTPGGTRSTVASGLTSPDGVAVDGAGTVYISDDSAHAVYQVPSGGSKTTVATVTSGGFGLAIDGSGNLYTSGQTPGPVIELGRATPPPVNFPNLTPVHTVDTTDGTMTVEMENIGTATLDISSVNFPTDFIKDTSGTDACGSTLGASALCNINIEFEPQSVNTSGFTEYVTIDDNSLYVSSASQSIKVTGASEVAPVLSVTKSHTGTFTQGSTAQWNITVSNAAGSGATSGTTNVSDTLPTGYTLASYSGTGWTCSGTTTVICSTTQSISGGGSSSLLQLTVNVAAASPISVSNTAYAYGGGSVTQTDLGNAASGSDSNVTVVQVPASITINGGGTQSTQISTAFGTPLAVTVKDAGGVAIPNSSVTFSAPPSGASGTFSNSSATITEITNTSGVATAGTFTANGTAGGPYSVSVTDSPATAASFSLTNISPPTVTAGATVTFVVGGSPVALDSGLMVSASTSTVTGATVSIAGGASADTLNFISQNGITGSFNASTLTLTLSGTAIVPIYQVALESVTFSTTSTNVTPRTINWTVIDSSVSSATATSTVNVLLPPTVTGISPSSGPTAGGTPVTITGTNFTGATGVTIGGVPATSVMVVSSTTITAVTPSGTAGKASVVVTTSGGSNAANTLFTYVAPPTVSGISPSSGKTAGGLNVTITGTNFIAATGVTIGGAPATNVVVVSSTTITATIPAGTAGPASVLVTSPYGSNAANSLFTYFAPPTISGISPSTGLTTGGTIVTITGTNLLGGMGVQFGSIAATITSVSSTQIVATAPVGSGTVDVTVITPGGTSAVSAADQFTYIAPIATSLTPTVTPSSTFVYSLQPSISVALSPSNAAGIGASDFTAMLDNSTMLTVTAGTDNNFNIALPATPLTVGAHSITVNFTGAIGYVASSTTIALTVTTPTLVVNTANDDSGSAANCTPQATPGTNTVDAACSLRDALLFATSAGSGNISFDSTKFAATNTVSQNTINLLSNGTLNIPSNTTITGATSGSGATLTNLVTVSGAGAWTVFTVGSGVTGAALNNLTITKGNGSIGGGINNSGTLTVSNSTFSSNTATGAGGSGGGIYNAGTLIVTNSTLSGNTVLDGFGGAISNSGILTVTNSTFSGNTAPSGTGGGIYNSFTLTVSNSTFSGNTAAFGPGIDNIGELYLANNLSADLWANPSANAVDYGGNVIAGWNGVLASSIKLSSLGNYGGPAQTIMPMPSSNGICSGTSSPGGGLTLPSTDQRGFGFVSTYCPSGHVDAGAVQTNYALSFTTEPGASQVAGVPFAAAVTLTESASPVSGVTIPLTLNGGGTLSGGSASTNASGVASYTLTVANSTALSGLSLTATLPSPPTLTSTSTNFNLFEPTPTVTGISPSSGIPSGGTSVTITGTNFAGATVVSFGSTPATAFTVVNSTTITATSPAESVGTVDVTVTTPGGTSATSAFDQYTYAKATAIVSLGNLNQTYTGLPLSATATTTPANLTVNITYNGLTAAPTAAGTYTVVGTISDPNYQGTATGTLTINQASQTITFPVGINPSTPAITTYTYSAGGSFTLRASTNSGLPTSFASLTNGVCTVNGITAYIVTAGTCTIQATQTGNANYSAANPVSAYFTITQVAPTITQVTSLNPILLQNPVTYTATVSSTAGKPTGAVTFSDGGTAITACASAAVTASNGQANCAVTYTVTGTHNITAVYNGDTNFLAAGPSNTVSEAAIDINLGTPATTSETILPGATATYSFPLAPSSGTTFPSPLTFTVTSSPALPSGTTMTLTPSAWNFTTNNPWSWTLPANTSLTSDTVLTIQLPQTTASAQPASGNLVSRLAPFSLALFLLPFAGRLRKSGKRLGRKLAILLLAGAGAVTLAGLSGCGSNAGYFAQKQQSYTITVTVASGSLSHTSTVNLTVE